MYCNAIFLNVLEVQVNCTCFAEMKDFVSISKHLDRLGSALN